MFSSRQNWGLSPNTLSALVIEKRAAGRRILDLTQSNPTHARLTYPAQEILRAFADPKILEYDPDPRGIVTALEAVSAYYAQRGADAPPSRILLTASTSEAYGYLFKLLTDPGDDVLVPRPSYPLFEYLAAMESVHARQYPLRYDGGWHIDFEELERSIGPRTRAIVVVNPNNPTGSFLKQDELSRLESFAASRDLAILSDEVFSDYAFAPDASRVTSLTGDRSALTFSMSGLSKVAGLPQMKLGWIVASGPRYDEALLRLEWIADTYLSVATPVQLALPRLLSASAPVQAEILERAIGNLTVLKNLIGERVPAQVLAVEGGWSAVVQVPRTRSEEDWTLALLNERDVLVQPGFFFDFESEAFLIVSLLTNPTIFVEGVRRIVDAMV